MLIRKVLGIAVAMLFVVGSVWGHGISAIGHTHPDF